MKKRILFVLVLVSYLFLNVSAASIKEESTDVIVGEVDSPIYAVEITWGKMEFIYTEQVNYVWDNDSHVYELGSSSYNWVNKDNYVDVNNKSFTKINVELEYVSLKNDINGVFNVSNKEITSNAKERFTLTLNGKLDSSNLNYTKVGSINLKIS